MTPVYLNVASSHYVLEEFINIDNSLWLWLLPFSSLLSHILKPGHKQLLEAYLQASKKAKLVRYDCRKPLKYEEESVDHILCSHFLEHVYYDEAVEIVAGFYRILKPGATIHIIVPDITININQYIAGQGDPSAVHRFLVNTLLTQTKRPNLLYRLLELTGKFGLQHRWMYDEASIEYLLKSLNFTILDVNETPSKHFREGDDSIHVVAQKH